jgi:hypothetical protein
VIDMNRLARAVVAGVVGATFLVALLAVCPCPEMSAAADEGHGCCLGETALRSAEVACCPSPSTAARVVMAPSASAVSSLSAVSLSSVGSPALVVQTHEPASARRLFPPSGPPTVLRI